MYVPHRISFPCPALTYVRTIQSKLPKFVQINWCGDGVPEAKKGLFHTHSSAVARFLRGTHVVISARNEVRWSSIHLSLSTLMTKTKHSPMSHPLLSWPESEPPPAQSTQRTMRRLASLSRSRLSGRITCRWGKWTSMSFGRRRLLLRSRCLVVRQNRSGRRLRYMGGVEWREVHRRMRGRRRSLRLRQSHPHLLRLRPLGLLSVL